VRVRGEHGMGNANQFWRNKQWGVLENSLCMGWNSNEKETKSHQIINTIFVNDIFVNNQNNN